MGDSLEAALSSPAHCSPSRAEADVASALDIDREERERLLGPPVDRCEDRLTVRLALRCVRHLDRAPVDLEIAEPRDALRLAVDDRDSRVAAQVE